MGGVVEVRGQIPAVGAEPVPSYHHDGQAGRSQVLLGAAVDEIEPPPVDRSAQKVRTHVGHHRHSDVGEVREPDSVDRLVAGHVYVPGSGPDVDLATLCWHTGEAGASAGPGFVGAGHLPPVGEGLGGPRPSVHVARRFVLGQQVQRHLGELEGCPALEKKNREVVRHAGQGPKARQGIVVYGVVGGGPVAVLDDGHADALEVEELVADRLEDRHGERAGPRTEVVDTGHHGFPLGRARAGRNGRRGRCRRPLRLSQPHGPAAQALSPRTRAGGAPVRPPPQSGSPTRRAPPGRSTPVRQLRGGRSRRSSGPPR